MQIVINIPDKVYENAKNGMLDELQSMLICGSVTEGTPLPKGHGRLIDADKYRKDMQDSREFNFFATLDFQQTLVEADKEENPEVLEQEPCEDAISRAEVKNKAIQIWNGDGDEDYKFSTLIDYITDLPPVTPTRKHGEWEREEFDLGADLPIWVCYKCSECGNYSDSKFNFCPHCGADIRGEEDGNK